MLYKNFSISKKLHLVDIAADMTNCTINRIYKYLKISAFVIGVLYFSFLSRVIQADGIRDFRTFMIGIIPVIIIIFFPYTIKTIFLELPLKIYNNYKNKNHK